MHPFVEWFCFVSFAATAGLAATIAAIAFIAWDREFFREYLGAFCRMLLLSSIPGAILFYHEFMQ